MAAQTPPNVLFIMADDLGYADLSCYGQTDYATPHLDRMAAAGIRFTQGYANSAVCSATRIALMTGRYQYRLAAGLEEPLGRASAHLGLPPEHPTLPSLLRDAGYRTALVGKWHMGNPPQFGPLKSGYDYFFGILGGGADYFNHGPDSPASLYEGDTPIARQGYLTDLLGGRAVELLETYRSSRQPFFMSLNFTAPHWPWEGPGDEAVSRRMSTMQGLFHYDGGAQRTYGAMVQSLDTNIGRVLATLDNIGRSENTLVIFSSDNGGERFSKTWPLTGMKTELLEGGLRVPMIARWPERVQRRVSDQVMITMDWVPTILAATGLVSHPDYPSDGEDLSPALNGAASHPRTLFWRYKFAAQRAVRDGDWKYLRIAGNEFLFDLAVDPRERGNLKAHHPEMFERLKARYEQWNATMLPETSTPSTAHNSGKNLADHYGVDGEMRG